MVNFSEKRTGLFFGSFNPIHIGHLIIANHLVQYTELEEVWFVISPHNPLKAKSSLLADYHRYALVNYAIEDNPHLWASNIEFGLPQPSYTAHTLSFLEEKYPLKHFALIMGEDNLVQLKRWKNYEYILDRFQIYVYPRPAVEWSEFHNHPKVTLIKDMPRMEISSSFIRQAIKDGKDVKYLLPEAAYEYVKEMHFYEK
jgi:nicotinate-nucleotide adenylyltransferase